MSHSATSHGWLSSIGPARRERTLGLARRRAARRGLILEQLEDRTVLSTLFLIVNTLGDDPGGPAPGFTTLRDAITTADNDTSNSYVIDFDVTGAINLASSLPGLDNNITIQGPGASSLTVQPATGTVEGIFGIAANVTVSISGLTIANGSADSGGGIDNLGMATVTNCTLANDSAQFGGGIDNSGTLTVTNCTLANDFASFHGGGIGNGGDGTLTVTNCTLTNDSVVNNTVGSSANGGGIENLGTSTVTNSTLTNDYAVDNGGTAAGGGIGNDNSASLTVTNCTLANDSAQSGGGINSTGTLTVTNCTLTNDSATGGGGIMSSGRLTVANSTLANDSGGNGAGIFVVAGTATVTNSTLANEFASGGSGIQNQGTLTVTNSTLANDFATDQGGGIINLGTLTVTNSTLANDSAQSGGGIENIGTLTVTNSTLANDSAQSGGGILNFQMATLNNTIVADSPSGGDVNTTGSLTGSHDLISDGSGGLAGTITGDPLLGPLQDNGGPTQTMALLPGSPAIDAGSNALAVDAINHPLSIDERGVARIVNGTVDIGAFESRSFSIALTSGSGQSATVNTGFLNPLVVTVTSPYGDPVQGGVVTVTAPAGGAGATFAGGTTATTSTINPAGQAGVAASANTVAGSYAVTVSARRASFPAGFSLTNRPGAAKQIMALRGTPQSTTVGYAFATPLQVIVTDGFGNAVPGVSVTYAAPTSGPSGTISDGNLVTTNAQGIAAPTFRANTAAGGSYTVTATAGDLSGSPASFSLTNTPNAARSFVVSGFPSSTAASAASSFTVTALDQYDNVATGYRGTVHFTSTDPIAVFPTNNVVLTSGTGTFSATLKTAGTQSITATDSAAPSLTATQSEITVNPAGATSFIIKAPATVSPGTPVSFTVTAVDADGNVATGYSGTIVFSSNNKAALPTYSILTNGEGTFSATFMGPASTPKMQNTQTLKATDFASSSITGTVTIILDPRVKQEGHGRGRRGRHPDGHRHR
jgi:hypothetical protein